MSKPANVINKTLIMQEDQTASVARSVKIALEAKKLAADSNLLLQKQHEQLLYATNTMEKLDSSIDHVGNQTDRITKLANTPFFIPVGKTPTRSDSNQQPKSSMMPVFTTRTSSLPQNVQPTIARGESNALKMQCETVEEQSKFDRGEKEIDSGLDMLADAMGSIKGMAIGMQHTLIKEKQIIAELDEKISKNTEKLNRTNGKLGNLLKR